MATRGAAVTHSAVEARRRAQLTSCTLMYYSPRKPFLFALHHRLGFRDAYLVLSCLQERCCHFKYKVLCKIMRIMSGVRRAHFAPVGQLQCRRCSPPHATAQGRLCRFGCRESTPASVCSPLRITAFAYQRIRRLYVHNIASAVFDAAGALLAQFGRDDCQQCWSAPSGQHTNNARFARTSIFLISPSLQVRGGKLHARAPDEIIKPAPPLEVRVRCVGTLDIV